MDSRVLLLLCISFTSVMCADKSFEGDKVMVKVLGQSGKIVIAPNDGSSSIDSSPDRVQITMDKLVEIDEAGDEIGEHRFNTFANQDFTFSPLEDGTYEGLSNENVKFSAALTGMTSTLDVTLFIFKEEGTLTFDGESMDVDNSTAKWNIEVNKWEWCDPCTQGQKSSTGKYLDFTITIKGKSDGAPESKDDGSDTSNYDLGGDATLMLSNKVRTGDTWVDMASGYPKVETNGQKTSYTFRFAKNGADDFFYDPAIQYGAGMRSAANVVIVTLLATLLSVFIMM